MNKIKRALLSCTNKSGLVELAVFLQSQNIEILSTGGTAETLRQAGVTVRDVADYTQFPEMLDGRIKTLHPKVHGGLLFRRDKPQHQASIEKFGIEPLDLIVVNLYEFSKTIQNTHSTYEDAIENIDIGGPAMLRSAAKNHEFVTVITDPQDYELVKNEILNWGHTTLETRKKLALKVFQTTALYDSQIASYLEKSIHEHSTFPETQILSMKKIGDLRYGENPHQHASFYKTHNSGFSLLKQHQGKELSFNNLLDADSAYRTVLEFQEPACAIVKHNNPCGVALGQNASEAFDKAKACDPVSSFGGVIAINRVVDQILAQKISQTFFEVVLAPEFSPESLAILASKKNLRLISLPDFHSQESHQLYDLRFITGSALLQTPDNTHEDIKNSARVVTQRAPTLEEWLDLDFVWKVAKHVKSNAIIFGKNKQTLGIGAGQMSRIDSTRIGAIKAKEAFGESQILKSSVLASDAFFPFRDGLDEAIALGITAVVQPGGSVRDDEVIQSANENNVAMIFTGIRHFRH